MTDLIMSSVSKTMRERIANYFERFCYWMATRIFRLPEAPAGERLLAGEDI